MPLSSTINLQKNGIKFGVKNQLQQKHIRSQKIANASYCRVGNIPSLLNHIVFSSISLPLQSYQLKVQGPRAIGIVGNRLTDKKFAITFSDKLFLNHPEPVFTSNRFTAVLLDEQTIINVTEYLKHVNDTRNHVPTRSSRQN